MKRKPTWWLALGLLIWTGASLADAVLSPPVWAGMYIDNAVGTTDTSVNLLAVVTGYPTFQATRSITIKNDSASGGPGLLITLDGTTTATTPTVNTTQSTILVRAQESFQADGNYKALHYRGDSLNVSASMRGIFLY